MSALARVLVVDDSPTMRGLISAVLKADPEVEVVGRRPAMPWKRAPPSSSSIPMS